MQVRPIAADYMREEQLSGLDASTGRRVGFFPGSTIGNFEAPEAMAFLRLAARLLEGGGLLVGVDLVKDPDILHRAYNDAQGVTAAFNLNVLHRANTELSADFDLREFAHYAYYDPHKHRIEMHLVSRCAQRVRVAGAEGNEVVLAGGVNAGETVVVAGVHVLTPGQKVRLYAERATTAVNGAIASSR